MRHFGSRHFASRHFATRHFHGVEATPEPAPRRRRNVWWPNLVAPPAKKPKPRKLPELVPAGPLALALLEADELL